jgi:hypothetical protein
VLEPVAAPYTGTDGIGLCLFVDVLSLIFSCDPVFVVYLLVCVFSQSLVSFHVMIEGM